MSILVQNRLKDIWCLLLQSKQQLQMALPAHMTADRVLRVALTELRRNPRLQECDPKSVLASVMLAAQLGLEIGVLGQAYLVPYKQTCTLIPGWQGYMSLLYRSGQAMAWTGAVYEGDEFEYQLGTSPNIRHRPHGAGDPSSMSHVYAVGKVKGFEDPIIEVWPISRVWAHRDRYNRVGAEHYSYQYPEQYARKVVLLRVMDYLPRSIEIAQALEVERRAETGQGYTLEEVVGGTEALAEQPPDVAPTGESPVEEAAQKVREAVKRQKQAAQQPIIIAEPSEGSEGKEV